MPLKFACPSCQQTILSKRPAGDAVTCPKCKCNFNVPGPQEASSGVAVKRGSALERPVEKTPATGGRLGAAVAKSAVQALGLAAATTPAATTERPMPRIDYRRVSIRRWVLYAQAARSR